MGSTLAVTVPDYYKRDTCSSRASPFFRFLIMTPKRRKSFQPPGNTTPTTNLQLDSTDCTPSPKPHEYIIFDPGVEVTAKSVVAHSLPTIMESTGNWGGTESYPVIPRIEGVSDIDADEEV